jgi:hypothetical protein
VIVGQDWVKHDKQVSCGLNDAHEHDYHGLPICESPALTAVNLESNLADAEGQCDIIAFSSHFLSSCCPKQDVDARDERGHDEE